MLTKTWHMLQQRQIRRHVREMLINIQREKLRKSHTVSLTNPKVTAVDIEMRANSFGMQTYLHCHCTLSDYSFDPLAFCQGSVWETVERRAGSFFCPPGNWLIVGNGFCLHICTLTWTHVFQIILCWCVLRDKKIFGMKNNTDTGSTGRV